MNEYLTQKKDQ